MQSKATTVQAYLESLDPERREALERVRRVILDNLDRRGPEGKGGYQEGMQYGMIGYFVPHSVWPHGYHCDPKVALPYVGLASQKNHMAIYMMCLYGHKPMREWFEKAWKATGKKLDMGGACLRFKRVEDLSLELVGEVVKRVPVEKYLEHYVGALAQMGKGVDGKPLKAAKAGPAGGGKGAKMSGKKKTAKKKAAKKKMARR